MSKHEPPQWELDMIADVSEWWGITHEEAEVFLEEINAFGSRGDWPSEADDE